MLLPVTSNYSETTIEEKQTSKVKICGQKQSQQMLLSPLPFDNTPTIKLQLQNISRHAQRLILPPLLKFPSNTLVSA
jgi:hypothetical protein